MATIQEVLDRLLARIDAVNAKAAAEVRKRPVPTQVGAALAGAQDAAAARAAIGAAADGVLPYLWDGTTKGGTPGTTYVPASVSALDDATGWEWEGTAGSISGGAATIPAGSMLTLALDVPVGKSVRTRVEVTAGASGHAEVGYFDASWGWINGPGWDPTWTGPGSYASAYTQVPAGAVNGMKVKISNDAASPMTVTLVQVEEADTPGTGGRPAATWVEWRSATDPTGLPDFDRIHDTWLPTVVV
ncbi:hypothetical protein [Arsenicicoccus dermatophilus]|uniref:hypothetical protein n=1 Tax=Arsenicicoccus dermatophilus TaxID=1076331 RepID=UPI001F4C7A64|nr:hypothetical protein [Arsenicicoccus dermatophilus]MCH8613481.1 hypothetical protein [Arsenicicoccus dermatophilus]